MKFRTESGESERHWIWLVFTKNLKKSNEKDSEDTPNLKLPGGPEEDLSDPGAFDLL
jgi:hypothetical protein